MTSTRLTEDEDQLIAALRKGTATCDPHDVGAVEHLITYDYWLHRNDFVSTGVRHGDAENRDEDQAWIERDTTRMAFERGDFDGASSSERFQLQFTVTVGLNGFRSGALGRGSARMVVRTVAAAYGLGLETIVRSTG